SGTFTLTGIAASSYDFMAIASNGITFWQTSSVSITAGGAATWTLLQPDVGSLSVMNNHCLPLAELYLTPLSAPTWGPIHLLTPVDPLGTFTLTDIPVGTYDAYAVAIDGVNWTTYGIPITAGGDYPWGPLYMPAGTGCLTVVNESTVSIGYLYDPPSPSGCTSDLWGNEQLVGATIPPCFPPAPCPAFTLSNVPAGAHDLRARDVDFTVDPRRCGAAIPPGGTYFWHVTP
ncbi:MAG TPA: hypothetical protein VFR85_12565, partial [Anaeromyxobacteraceae bacterium]|nr:hypothetical protein [Anaeromyxobacteraceae bacterium]